MLKSLLLPLAFILFGNTAFSQTRLPAMFSDNMILQQQQQVAVWGVDKPFAKITVYGSWGNKATVTTAANGQWKLKLQTPAAGGPFTLVIKGSKELTFKNVLIGEVWFCSGQSNMEMPVIGYGKEPLAGSNEVILNSSNDQIRFLNTPRSASLTPSYDVSGEWKVASAATTGNFSAAAYFFAKKLQAVLGVPVGIIQSAWGASTIESWMDAESLAAFTNKIIPEKLPDANPNRTPTILYNTMLHPYIGYTIKGMLWYQGEANRENADEYQALCTAMIASWRKQWQQGDFPFYFVQIAPFGAGKANAAFLREAQLKTMLSVKNTGMAVTMDIGEEKEIHPSQKVAVGNRLAFWALAKDYHFKEITFSGPVYKRMQPTGDGKLIVTFDYSEAGLTGFGKPLTEFEIAGEDKVFYPAQAIINKDKTGSITVWNDQVKNPVSVRYAFKSWAAGSLYNLQGLPASSFRTDDW